MTEALLICVVCHDDIAAHGGTQCAECDAITRPWRDAERKEEWRREVGLARLDSYRLPRD